MIKFFLFLFKNKRFFITKIYAFYNESKQKENFVHKFGYWPEGLEYSNFDYLDLSENTRIGNYNKLVLSETKFPSSNKKSLISLAPNTWTGTGVELNVISGSQIIIKQYSTIQDYCKLIGDIVIERYCVFAPMVYISSGNHYAEKGNPDLIRNQDLLHLTNKELLEQHSKKVHIEEDCWVGIGTFIRQGVYIGRGAIIGANACITTDVLPYSIVVGNNKTINSRIVFNPLMQIEASNKEHLPYFYRGFIQKKSDLEMLEFKDAAFFGDKSVVIVLAKADFNLLTICGKTSFLENKNTIRIHINKNLIADINIETDDKGSFSTSLKYSVFSENKNETKEDAFILSNNYNVFKIELLDNIELTETNFFGIQTFKQN